MLNGYKYYMTITDVEVDDIYDYEGLFLDHMEADRFLTENEAVGNSIIIHKIEEVEIDPADLDRIYRD